MLGLDFKIARWTMQCCAAVVMWDGGLEDRAIVASEEEAIGYI